MCRIGFNGCIYIFTVYFIYESNISKMQISQREQRSNYNQELSNMSFSL